MFSNQYTPTPYYPFDAATVVNNLPIRDSSGASIKGGFVGPYLTPIQAFELRYNTKAMMIQVPTIAFFGVTGTGPFESASGNVIVYRYNVGNSINNIRFSSFGNLSSTALSFFMDFSLGASIFGESPATTAVYFTPISQYSVTAVAGGAVQYNVVGSSTVNFTLGGFFPINLLGFRYSNSAFGISAELVSNDIDFDNNPPFILNDFNLVATEKIDEIYFTPSAIQSSVDNTITITCPPTTYAKNNSFDLPSCRTGFQFLSKIWLNGLASPILSATISPTNVPRFSLVKNANGVSDTVVITLPANSGVKTGRVGMTMAYPTASGTVDGSTDYFETIPELVVI